MDGFQFGNIGFDTGRKVWFIDLYDPPRPPVDHLEAAQIIVKNGGANQFGWHDENGEWWHVRERFYAKDVEEIKLERGLVEGKIVNRIVVTCKPNVKQLNIVPDDYDVLRYAYDVRGDSRGFIEFFKGDVLVKRIGGLWVHVEGIPRCTVGEYPKVRMEVKRGDVSELLITETVAVIRGA